jgi:hypothetical protein
VLKRYCYHLLFWSRYGVLFLHLAFLGKLLGRSHVRITAQSQNAQCCVTQSKTGLLCPPHSAPHCCIAPHTPHIHSLPSDSASGMDHVLWHQNKYPSELCKKLQATIWTSSLTSFTGRFFLNASLSKKNQREKNLTYYKAPSSTQNNVNF